jgi:hypothetical protein
MRSVTASASRLWLPGLSLVVLAFVLSACQPRRAEAALATVPTVQKILTKEAVPTLTAAPTVTLKAKIPATPTEDLVQLQPEAAGRTASPTPTSALVERMTISVEEWKRWPVIPQVPVNARALYQQGLKLGRDPHAFSIIGDCQSLPESFLGVYDTDPALVASLQPDLQEAVENFAGSFDRQSPTIKGGTTAGAALWSEWHENKFTCQANETPLDCELRLHNPSIVIINLGTHYETRNITYLRKILDELTGLGIVAILATKADNRELDDRLNQEMALLADEYKVPLWNFFAAVSDLPNNGVGVKKGEEHLGEIYLSDEGLERHRYTALQALAAVWLAVK